MKNNLLLIYSTNILVRLLTVNIKNFLTPKNPKMCDPILVTVLKRRPHYSQSSRENATPSSGTFPLASYKEVPPPDRTPTRNLAFWPFSSVNIWLQFQLRVNILTKKEKQQLNSHERFRIIVVPGSFLRFI